MSALKVISRRNDSLVVANKIAWPGGRPLPAQFRPGAVILPSGVVVGMIDSATAKADETGLLVHRILNRRNRYIQMLEKLLEAGLLSDQAVVKAGGGQLIIDKDVLILAPTAQKSFHFDFKAAVTARALGLDIDPQRLQIVERLRIKAAELREEARRL